MWINHENTPNESPRVAETTEGVTDGKGGRTV